MSDLKLPIVKAADLIKALEKLGFTCTSPLGSGWGQANSLKSDGNRGGNGQKEAL